MAELVRELGPDTRTTDTGTAGAKPERVPRLQVKETIGEALLDGAWWPEARDLGPELRTLAEHWPERLGRIARARYSQADWDSAPRRILSRGAIIPAASFPDEDSHKIVLTMSGSRRLIELLVVPVDCSSDDAELAFEAANRHGSRLTAVEILRVLAPERHRSQRSATAPAS